MDSSQRGVVLVVARLRLHVDAVSTALPSVLGDDGGPLVVGMRWDEGFEGIDAAVAGALSASGAEPGASVGVLLLDDLRTWEERRAAVALVDAASSPVLVLSGSPGAVWWGELLARPHVAVRPLETPLDELGRLVADVVAGHDVEPPDERRERVARWQAWEQEAAAFRARLATLSEREWRVLRALAGGRRVAEVARRQGVAESTVRSQVKSARRKLRVNSQLAMVTALHRYAPELLRAPAVPAPRAAPPAGRSTPAPHPPGRVG